MRELAEAFNIWNKNVQTSLSIRTFSKQMRKPAEASEYIENQFKHSNIFKTNAQTSWGIRTFQIQMCKPAQAFEYLK